MALPRLFSNFDREAIKKRRLFTEGSIAHKVTITDLATTAIKIYGFDDSTMRKYLPLNYLRIVNKGGEDLKIYMNQNPNAEEIILDDMTYEYFGDFYTFKLENVGSGTATGANIYTTVQRKPVGG